MFIHKKHLPRRTFLKGAAGASLALPLLDAMIPAASAQNSAHPRQRRTAFVYAPHGIILDQWVPATQGADYGMTPCLKPLEDFRAQMQVFSNLQANPANRIGSGHASASSTWLSGAVAKDTKGADVEAGKTIDQIIAEHLGQDTPLPSIELGIEDTSNMIGVCDGTSSCGYLNTISWRADTAPLPMEINPRTIFERMFGSGATTEERLQRAQLDRSLLDSIMQASGSLERKLGVRDQQRLHDYLDNVREVERRIGNLERRMTERGSNLQSAPVEIPEAYEDHVRLMFDLQALALQTDTSRVTSFMLSRELNQRTYPQIGVPEQHHSVSHHGYRPEMMAKNAIINTYHVSLFAEFVARLQATEDVDGNLLDNTMILYGSGMSDSNVHSRDPVSNLIIGGGAGRLRGGHHTAMPELTPLSNLLLGIMDVAGIHMESIGNSNGRIALG